MFYLLTYLLTILVKDLVFIYIAESLIAVVA